MKLPFLRVVILLVSASPPRATWPQKKRTPRPTKASLSKTFPSSCRSPISAARPARRCGCGSSATGRSGLRVQPVGPRSAGRPGMLHQGAERGARARSASAPGRCGTRFPPVRQTRTIEAQWQALHADLAAGIPSIVCMHYDSRPGSPEHFRLVLGYDAATDEVIYHEPARADGAYRRMPRADVPSHCGRSAPARGKRP